MKESNKENVIFFSIVIDAENKNFTILMLPYTFLELSMIGWLVFPTLLNSVAKKIIKRHFCYIQSNKYGAKSWVFVMPRSLQLFVMKMYVNIKYHK